MAQPTAMATTIREKLAIQIAFQSAFSCSYLFAITNIQRTIGTATSRINRPTKPNEGTDNANSAPIILAYTPKTTDIEATDRRQESALTATDKATFPLAITV